MPLADSSAVLRCFMDRKPELDWVWKDLWKAVDDLYRCDVDLFKNNVSERCLASTLVKHLWNQTRNNGIYLNLSVQWDGEYNRHGPSLDPKIIDGHCRTPDLVLHERGTDAQNLCVIEVKKHHARSFDNRSPNNQSKDIKVLEAMTAPEGAFRYRSGLLLILNPRKIEMLSFPERTWHSFAPPPQS